jgi:hypothetical protein
VLGIDPFIMMTTYLLAFVQIYILNASQSYRHMF